MKHRQYGTIQRVEYAPLRLRPDPGHRDHRCLRRGSQEKFGGVPIGFEAWKRELCETFDVQGFEDLPGKKCWVLRSFAEFHEPIEGLEAPNGKRFTRTGYARRHGRDPLYPNRLHCRVAYISDEISRLELRIAEMRHTLHGLSNRYFEWEEETKP